jgi:septum site-determining protein MinC
MAHTADREQPQEPLALKGSLFTLLVLHPHTTDRQQLAAALDERLEKLPSFFVDAPIVIDLAAERWQLEATAEQVAGLASLIRERRLLPVAVRNCPEALRGEVVTAGLGLLPESRIDLAAQGEATAQPSSAEGVEGGEPVGSEQSQPQPVRTTRVVTSQVRSGQQVYAAGDLILLAPVSSGGEVLADGHIHCYAPLRGRALAGIRGDESARIFCRMLDAELVSVAGNYRLAEDIGDDQRGHPAHIRLDGDRLIIETL